MLRIPAIGDKVELHIPAFATGYGDAEVAVPAGTKFTIASRRLLRNSQGLQFELGNAEHGILIFIDQTDLVDGHYPFTISSD